MIKDQLEALGIGVNIIVNDDPDATNGFAAGTGFDMLLWAQHTLPGQSIDLAVNRPGYEFIVFDLT